MASWVLQCDPKRFRFIECVIDQPEMGWVARQNAGKIAVGDKLVFWLAGPDAGAYGLGQVIGLPTELPEAPDILPFWTEAADAKPEMRLRARVDRVIALYPVLRTTALADPVLSELAVVRRPNSTVFPLTEAQYDALVARMDARPIEWSREELLLTLDLYVEAKAGRVANRAAAARRLARLFDRSPDAIALRLGNYESLDPASAVKGLSNRGQGAADMWQELATRPEQLRETAAAIMTRLLKGGGLAPRQRYWKIAPGEQASRWNEMRGDGVIAIGWDAVGDLGAYSTKEQLRDAVAKAYPNDSPKQWEVTTGQMWTFAREIHKGDIVFANHGRSRLVGRGEVIGPYVHRPARPFAHALPVTWLDEAAREVPDQGGSWNRTIAELSAADYGRLLTGAAPIAFDRNSVTVVRAAIEKWFPDAHVRRVCIEFLADAIEYAHTRGESRWAVTLRKSPKIHLNVGRLLACGLYPNQLWFAIEPSDMTVTHAAQLDLSTSAAPDTFVLAPDAKTYFVDAALVEQLRPQIWAAFCAFIDTAAMTAKQTPYRASHSPGVLDYLEQTLGRKLPRPVYTDEPLEFEDDDEAELAAADDVVGELEPDGAARASLPTVAQALDLPPFTVADALAEVFMTERNFVEMIELLRYKKNLILAGPPGVGKTFVASSLAFALMEQRDDSRLERVQFHQSYGYEDFVRGFRPKESGGFEFRDGPFLAFCDRAHRDPERPYVLIVDEINRGNLSKILGELMLLIEGDKRSEKWSVRLTYAKPGEGRFFVPPNLYVVGTMNTADRSLAMVDYALRRRFAFVDVKPAFDEPRFREHLGAVVGVAPELQEKIITRLSTLNQRIADDRRNLGAGYCIGHSYFCQKPAHVACDDAWFERIVRFEIGQLLKEYWFDDEAKVDAALAQLRA